MLTLIRFIFFQLFIRPLVNVLLGLNVTHRQRLPYKGPAIIVANHNSHLDTMALMTLFPWKLQNVIRPVAAADYFLKRKYLAWFSKNIIRIIPLQRGQAKQNPNLFTDIQQALDQHEIIIFYPEGSRGEPERMSDIKKGIAHLAKANPSVPIYPVYIYGLGKSLPKDESLLVPFVIDVAIGEAIDSRACNDQLVDVLKNAFYRLQKDIPTREWD